MSEDSIVHKITHATLWHGALSSTAKVIALDEDKTHLLCVHLQAVEKWFVL